MMTDLRLPLVALGFVGVVVAVRVSALPLADTSPPSIADGPSISRTPDSARGSTAELGAGIVSRDPFRLGRRPALPAYDPLRLAEQLAPPAPKPTLVLVGVVDGRSPSAIIEGMPTVDGSRVVRVGDVIGGLSVKTISNRRVVISGMDTTWVLEVREPWKN